MKESSSPLSNSNTKSSLTTHNSPPSLSTSTSSSHPSPSHHSHAQHHTFLPPHPYIIQQKEPTSLEKAIAEKSRKEVKRLHSIDFISGSIAAIVSDTVLQPLDTVKTRQQFSSSQFAYRNIFDAFYTIGKSEGLKGLFRGWVCYN